MCACSLALQLLTQLRVAWRHAVNMLARFMLGSQSGCHEWTCVAPKASVPQMEPRFVQGADQFTQLCKNQHYPNLKAWLKHRGQLLVLSLAVLGQRTLECPIICVSKTRFDSFSWWGHQQIRNRHRNFYKDLCRWQSMQPHVWFGVNIGTSSNFG